MRKITSYIPNTITSLNLVSGCVALYMAFNLDGRFGPLVGREWCYVMIAAAALFDFCDGLSARLLHAYSEIGKQLDSLSDLVSFGVAPAALIYNVMAQHSEYPWLCCAALIIPVCGALRLARFNISTEQTDSFIGLPIPANAIFWIGMSGWIERYCYPGTAVMAILCLLVSLSMVSNIHMFSLKFKNLSLRDNLRRYVLILAAVAFVVFYGLSGLLWAIVLYVLMSLLSRRSA